jgi:hypothetical protein
LILVSAVLLLAAFAVPFSDTLLAPFANGLRRLGVLRPVSVDFDDLLDELYFYWPPDRHDGACSWRRWTARPN